MCYLFATCQTGQTSSNFSTIGCRGMEGSEILRFWSEARKRKCNYTGILTVHHPRIQFSGGDSQMVQTRWIISRARMSEPPAVSTSRPAHDCCRRVAGAAPVLPNPEQQASDNQRLEFKTGYPKPTVTKAKGFSAASISVKATQRLRLKSKNT